jgi:hypothetical protein
MPNTPRTSSSHRVVNRHSLVRRGVVAASGFLLLAFGAALVPFGERLVSSLYEMSRSTLLGGVILRGSDSFGVDAYTQIAATRSPEVAVVAVLLGAALLLYAAWPDSTQLNRSVLPPPSQRGIVTFLVLFGFSASLRIATIVNPSTIDWDENTFLTVASRVAQGELPFVTTLDNKPPLFPLQQAVALLGGLTNPSLMRGVLAAIIALTAFLVVRATAVHSPTHVGPWSAGIFLIVATSVSPAGGAWMSQTSANLLLALLMLLILSDRTSRWRWMQLGAVAAAVTLTRTNYAFPAAALLLVALLQHHPEGRARITRDVALGGGLLTAAVVLPYAATDTIAYLRVGLFDVLLGPGGQAATVPDTQGLPVWVLPLVALQVAVLATSGHGSNGAMSGWWRETLRGPRVVPLSAQFGMLASLLFHSTLWTHYSIMLLVPVAAQIGLIGGGRHATSRRSLTVPALAVVVLLVLAASGTSGLLSQSEEARREASVVQRLDLLVDGRDLRVWAISDNYVNWRTRTAPAHPIVAFPGGPDIPVVRQNVGLYGDEPVPGTTLEAMLLVLDRSPHYIVSSPGLTEGYLGEMLTEDALGVLRDEIDRHYRTVWTDASGRTAIRECLDC